MLLVVGGRCCCTIFVESLAQLVGTSEFCLCEFVITRRTITCGGRAAVAVCRIFPRVLADAFLLMHFCCIACNS